MQLHILFSIAVLTGCTYKTEIKGVCYVRVRYLLNYMYTTTCVMFYVCVMCVMYALLCDILDRTSVCNVTTLYLGLL